jgi:3-deoxy-D-manno-octulosonic-acid transferase
MTARDLTAGLYAAVAGAATPVWRGWLKRRVAAGKEDPDRIAERRGIASRPRPPGALLWVHGASVGELRSALVLLELIARARPDAHVLITSGTRTSAEMVAQAAPPQSIHQFVPLDVPGWIDRFLDHWRPDAALWLESELWPNLIRRARARGIPMALVNGRLSDRSFARWQRLRRLVAPPVAAFAPVLAQSEADAARFAALGAAARCVGNLKFDGAALAADEGALAALRAALGTRTVWAATSTWPGEEEMVARANARVREVHPDALAIIAPRHPPRGPEIAAALNAAGHRFAVRSAGGLPAADHDLYLADTLGELGVVYRVASVAFIGKSLVPLGGQNPIEPARLGVPPIFGPHMTNFRDVVATMVEAGGAITVADEAALAATVTRLLSDAAERSRLAARAATVAEQGRGAAARVLEALGPLLENLPTADRRDPPGGAHARA